MMGTGNSRFIASVAVMLVCGAAYATVVLTPKEDAPFTKELAVAPQGKVMTMPGYRFMFPPCGLEPVKFVLSESLYNNQNEMIVAYTFSRGSYRVVPGFVFRIRGERDGEKIETNAVAFKLHIEDKPIYSDSQTRPPEFVARSIVTWVWAWIPWDFRADKLNHRVISIIAAPDFPSPTSPLPRSGSDSNWCGLVAAKPPTGERN